MGKFNLQIIALTVAIALTNCNFGTANDNNNEELLTLAILNQQGIINFTEVTPGFLLRSGERGFFNPGPWGEAETKASIANLERETAMDVTITLTDASGYAYFTANSSDNLTVERALTFMRLEQAGIRGVLEDNNFSPANNLPSGIPGTNTTGAGRFSLVPGVARTFCLEIHRKFKGTANPYRVEGHLIAWDKPCEQLTTADRGSYTWEMESNIFTNINLPNDIATRIASHAGVGYVTRNALVSVRPFNRKFGTAGSIR